MKHFNFLIVGQGLAGTLLSYQLIKKSQSFLVIDDIKFISSSKVAAGMFSPVGGKRMLKTWLSETLIEYLNNSYLDIEKILNTKFYYQQSILQAFQDNEIEIYNKINNLDENDERKKYINTNNKNFENINTNSGSILLNGGGWINTEVLLNTFENYLKSKNQLINDVFDYKYLEKQNDVWIYKDLSFDNIVFCEGHKAINNPFFNWIPFQLCKGEVININVKDISKDYILKKGIYLVNLNNDIYKVGASYEWKDLSLESTEKGINFITDKLDKFIKPKYNIIKKLSGIRPTVLDKKPLLGEHNENKNMYIFNGLGTKGVMIAPYFSSVLLDFVLDKKELPNEVNITRFIKT